MAVVTIKNLLEAGVHFGHKTRRWNPKMKQFIFEARDGIYILDLQKTLEQLQLACNHIRQIVIKGGSVLFVGTKKQSKESIEKAGIDTKMHFVIERWLGGTLTNNATIRKSIQRLRYLDGLFEDGTAEGLPKKEISSINRERARLHKNLDGIKEMSKLPKVVFVVDPKRERIATAEARKLGIPIVGIVDTNCDPDIVDFPIPANDDAIKSVSLITSIIAKIVLEALQEREKLGIVVEETVPEPEVVEEAPRKPSRRPPRRKRAARPPERRDRDKVQAKKPVAAPGTAVEKPKPEAVPEKPKPVSETAKTVAAPKAPAKKPKPEAVPEKPKPVSETAKTEAAPETVVEKPKPKAVPEKPKPESETAKTEAAPETVVEKPKPKAVPEKPKPVSETAKTVAAPETVVEKPKPEAVPEKPKPESEAAKTEAAPKAPAKKPRAGSAPKAAKKEPEAPVEEPRHEADSTDKPENPIV